MSVISVVFGLIMVSALLPIGMEQLYNASWPAAMPGSVETLITTVLPIIAVISIVLLFVYAAYSNKR